MPGQPRRALCSPFRGGTAATRLQSHRGCARGERSPAREPPNPPQSPWSLCALLSLWWLGLQHPDFGDLSILRHPRPLFSPPCLVSSVRKGDIGAVTARLREWAKLVGITSVPGMVGVGRHLWIRPPQFPSLYQAETQTQALWKGFCTGPGHWVYLGNFRMLLPAAGDQSAASCSGDSSQQLGC